MTVLMLDGARLIASLVIALATGPVVRPFNGLLDWFRKGAMG